MRAIIAMIATAGVLTGCTPDVSLHEASQLQPDSAYFCMAPDGREAREVFGPSGNVTCPAPARFISQPFCDAVPRPPSDIAGFYQARARAARDGSLHGDSFEGQPFCVMPKLGPPRP